MCVFSTSNASDREDVQPFSELQSIHTLENDDQPNTTPNQPDRIDTNGLWCTLNCKCIRSAYPRLRFLRLNPILQRPLILPLPFLALKRRAPSSLPPCVLHGLVSPPVSLLYSRGRVERRRRSTVEDAPLVLQNLEVVLHELAVAAAAWVVVSPVLVSYLEQAEYSLRRLTSDSRHCNIDKNQGCAQQTEAGVSSKRPTRTSTPARGHFSPAACATKSDLIHIVSSRG